MTHHSEYIGIRTGSSLHSNSDGNQISNVSGRNVTTGIRLQNSTTTSISNISLVKGGGSIKGCSGVWLLNSSSHTTISRLSCSGYSRDKDDWALLTFNSDHLSLKDSQCDSIWLGWGSRSISLSNVDCGELIKIGNKASNVSLVNCRGQKLELCGKTKVTKTNCNFKTGGKVGLLSVAE